MMCTTWSVAVIRIYKLTVSPEGAKWSTSRHQHQLDCNVNNQQPPKSRVCVGCHALSMCSLPQFTMWCSRARVAVHGACRCFVGSRGQLWLQKKKKPGPASLGSPWNQNCDWMLQKCLQIINYHAPEKARFAAAINGSLAILIAKKIIIKTWCNIFVMSNVVLFFCNTCFLLLLQILLLHTFVSFYITLFFPLPFLIPGTSFAIAHVHCIHSAKTSGCGLSQLFTWLTW